MEISPYLVPDLLAPGLKLVFCGTAPSRSSAKAIAYYAHPQNRFWQALYESGLTPRQFQPEEYRELLALGMGLTDMCKTASGNDDEIPQDHWNAESFAQKIRHFQPEMVAFTSKTAASKYLKRLPTYGLQNERLGTTQLFVCPSPSPRARRYFDMALWQELANLV